jgi:hypothetical protein
VLTAVTGSSGCAAHVFVPPTGAPVAAPEAPAAWAAATRHCRNAATYSARVKVSGTAGSTHLNQTLAGAVTAIDHILLELRRFGQLGFRLAGEGAEATLLLAHDKRYITARADQIVEALTGLKWGPKRLLAVMTGCISQASDMSDGVRIGDVLSMTSGGAQMYLRQRHGAWQVAAGHVDGETIEVREMAGDWPHELRITSDAGRSPMVDLVITLDELNVNTAMRPSAFTVTVPVDATPLTLDELRSIGPLADKKTGGGAPAPARRLP